MNEKHKNVLGEELQACCYQPMTGFYRTGFCQTGPDDLGVHSVCVVMTQDFLEFSKAKGNDLSTPRPEMGFDGLKPGDRWCLCASRWKEAFDANMAPHIVLQATHEDTLQFASLSDLKKFAIDLS